MIRVANSQFLMFKTRPALVVFIFTHLLIPSCSLRYNLTNRSSRSRTLQVRETESYTFECNLVLIQTKNLFYTSCALPIQVDRPPHILII